MRRDRSSTALAAVAGAAAVVVAVAALWVPYASDAPLPRGSDVLTAWALLAGGYVLLRRALTVAALLYTAGVLWVAVGIGPKIGELISTPIARAALVPTALLAVAAMLLPDGRIQRLRRTAVAVPSIAVVMAAAIAGAGAFRFATVAIGTAMVASAVWGSQSRTHARSRRTVVAIGVGFVASGVAAAWSAFSPWFVASLHEVVMLVGSIAVVWQAMRYADLRRSVPISSARDALADALASVLDTAPLRIFFPDGKAGWLDPSGSVAEPPTHGRSILLRGDRDDRDDGDDGAAVIEPWIELDEATEEAVRRVLRAAATTAELRARMREQASEIDASRRRLEHAVQLEHSRIVELIQNGPLTTLTQARTLIAELDGGEALDARAGEADRVLREVMSGLDPVTVAGGIGPAIAALARGHGASCVVDAVVDIAPENASTVWFTCAEALANSAKHATRALTYVSLRAVGDRYELIVGDAGPGGADSDGPGIFGLRDRASSSGAALSIESPAGGGTVVRLVGPLNAAGDRLALMPSVTL
jgi:signal transduction histidine kinase